MVGDIIFFLKPVYCKPTIAIIITIHIFQNLRNHDGSQYHLLASSMNQEPGYITRFAIALLLKLLLRNKGKHFFLKVIPTATVAARIGSYKRIYNAKNNIFQL